MRALIVGLGSIGRRHLENLRNVEPGSHITVWRQHSKDMDFAGREYADRVVDRLDDVLSVRPNLALITSPASLHIETGLILAGQGIDLFIEKPLADRLGNIHELLDICRRRALVLMVGYNLRFCRPLQIVKQAIDEGKIGRILTIRAEVGRYLPHWRPDCDYRQTSSARRDLGGGAVLELSHELDYVRWLVGEVETVQAQVGRLSDLEIDVEDVAEIILGFNSGAIGSVHLDMIQKAPVRDCRIVGTKGTLVWDGINNLVRLFSADTGAWIDLHPAKDLDRNDMYVAELTHFLQCVKERLAPAVGGVEAKRVVEIALAVKRSSQQKQVIAL